VNANPRNLYRETAADSDTPLHGVVLLYEQAIEDIRRAVAALHRGDIEARTSELNHALLVVGQLQSVLDMDRGGDVARNLDRFYSLVRIRLVEAQVRVSATILEQQMKLLLLVREAWVELERTTRPTQPPGLLTPPGSFIG
jgi:flagellar protein FliS